MFLCIWNIFPEYDYFPSQNSAYHSAFAREIYSEESHIRELLPNSSLAKQFIDQHRAYHLMAALPIKYFAEPWQALKFLQVLFLSLSFLLLIRNKNIGISVAAVVATLLLYLSVDFGFKRFHLLRLESLILFFTLLAALFSSVVFNKKKYWVWFLYFWIAISFSWINLISLIFVVTASISFKEKVKISLMSITILLIHLFVLGQGMDGVLYFYDLILSNLFNKELINEWRPLRDFSYWILLPISLIFGQAVVLTKNRKLGAEFNVFLLSLLLTVAAFKYSRFMTAAVFFSVVGFYFVLVYFLQQRKQPKILLTLLLASLSLSAGGRLYLNADNTFKASTTEVPNFKKFSAWLVQQDMPNKRYINLFWEHWSFALWHLPDWVSEPGFSMAIYRKTSPSSLKCLKRVRSFSREITVSEWIECQTILSSRFKTDLMLVPKVARARTFLNSVTSTFSILYQDEYFALIEFQKTDFSDEPVKINLSELVSLDFFRNGKVFQTRSEQGKWLEQNGVEDLRNVISVWSFCRRGLATTAQCRQTLEVYANRLESHPVFVFPAVWGLLALELGVYTSKVDKIARTYLDSIDSQGFIKGIQYGQPQEYFYPGEMLIFLLKYVEISGGKEQAQEPIRKALQNALNRYTLFPHDFKVRWLSEAAGIYLVFFGPDQDIALGLGYLTSHISPRLLNNCPQFRETRNFMPGLWLEGLAKLPENFFSYKDKKILAHCAMATLKNVQLNGGRKAYYFTGNLKSELARFDNHAHTLSGVYDFVFGHHHPY
ncbi:MAG: hypothetical protein ACLGGX_05055 [Bdellovibrionia bacterium]